jgi:peptidoglycan/xylan/chitin deacetylase (PgdA/CDA1 family)
MYHALGQRRSVISTQPAAFDWQMRWLYVNRFQVVPLSCIVKHLKNGHSLPVRTVAVTFDDGFEGVYTHAFPTLARYGFTGTVFLVAEYCGRHNDWPGQPLSVPRLPLLNWSEINEMDRYGLEFGGHTFDHPRLDRLTPAALERQVVGSKTYIEERLGNAVSLFAYPYGRQSKKVIAAARRAYSGACTTRLGIVTQDSDPFALARIDVHYIQHPQLFRLMGTPIFPLYLALRRVLRVTASAVLRRRW